MFVDKEAQAFLLAPKEAERLGIPNEEGLNPLPFPFDRAADLVMRAEILRRNANRIDCTVLPAGSARSDAQVRQIEGQMLAHEVVMQALPYIASVEEEALAFGALKR